VSDLGELQERRAYECRLTPDRALASLEESEEFLLDRRLLTRTADSALPSLFAAFHEKPFSSESSGFGAWPATKWRWFAEIAARGYLVVGVHRGKNLLVTAEVTALLDPICRAEIERMSSADPSWRRLLKHLHDAGPSSREDLQVELGLKPRELTTLLAPLVRAGAVVSRSVVVRAGEGHAHASELARWDQISAAGNAGGGDPRDALKSLLVASVRAAVVTPKQEFKRWFSWPAYWDDAIVDELVTSDRLARVEGHVTVVG